MTSSPREERRKDHVWAENVRLRYPSRDRRKPADREPTPQRDIPRSEQDAMRLFEALIEEHGNWRGALRALHQLYERDGNLLFHKAEEAARDKARLVRDYEAAFSRGLKAGNEQADEQQIAIHAALTRAETAEREAASLRSDLEETKRRSLERCTEIASLRSQLGKVMTARGEGTGPCTCNNYPHLPTCGWDQREIALRSSNEALQASNAELRAQVDEHKQELVSVVERCAKAEAQLAEERARKERG